MPGDSALDSSRVSVAHRPDMMTGADTVMQIGSPAPEPRPCLAAARLRVVKNSVAGGMGVV